MEPNKILRILIIEDDTAREERIKSWLPDDVRPVVATSAGTAIGTLRLDSGLVYAGVMLDHDLQDHRATESDAMLSGRDVVDSMIEHLSRDVMILVHSVNEYGAASMIKNLRDAGFDVVRNSMDTLTENDLHAWVDEVRENWKDCNN